MVKLAGMLTDRPFLGKLPVLQPGELPSVGKASASHPITQSDTEPRQEMPKIVNKAEHALLRKTAKPTDAQCEHIGADNGCVGQRLST